VTDPPRFAHIDQDAIDACADLIARSGASAFEIGYVDDTPGSPWYAAATFKRWGGGELRREGGGPAEAADALSRRVLAGATCTRCHKPVALSGEHPDRCRWSRQGDRWTAGCMIVRVPIPHPEEPR
jgi:hypothetical protein